MSAWTALGVLFVGLKLAGAIAWSWWLVLAPLYGPPLLVGALVALFALFAQVSMRASSSPQDAQR